MLDLDDTHTRQVCELEAGHLRNRSLEADVAAIHGKLPRHDVGGAPKLDDLRSGITDARVIEVAEYGEIHKRVDRVRFALRFEIIDAAPAVVEGVVPDRLADAEDAIDRRHELETVAVSRPVHITARRNLDGGTPVSAVRTSRRYEDTRSGRVVEGFGEAAAQRVALPLCENRDET